MTAGVTAPPFFQSTAKEKFSSGETSQDQRFSCDDFHVGRHRRRGEKVLSKEEGPSDRERKREKERERERERREREEREREREREREKESQREREREKERERERNTHTHTLTHSLIDKTNLNLL